MPNELSPEHRSKLDSIVQQMSTDGESDDNIQLLVNDFKSKYGVKKKPELDENEASGSDSEPLAKPSEKSSTEDKERLLAGDSYIADAPGPDKTKLPDPLKTPKPKTSVTEGLPDQPIEEAIDKVATEKKAIIREKELIADEEYKKSIDTGQGRIMSDVGHVNQGFYGLPGDVLKSLGVGGAAIKRAITGEGKAQDDILFKTGEQYQKFIQELSPTNPAYQEELNAKASRALGDLLALGATGGFSRLGKAGALGAEKTIATVTPEAATGAIQMGINEYETAIQSGASEDEAFSAFIKNAAAGSILERIPVQHFFKRLDDVTGGGLRNVIKRGARGGTEEMVTEVVQQVFSNVNAANSYDKTRQILDGVSESGGIGFGLGFVINALGGKLRKLSSEAATPAEKMQYDKALALVNEKQVQMEGLDAEPLHPTPLVENRNTISTEIGVTETASELNTNVDELVKERLNPTTDISVEGINVSKDIPNNTDNISTESVVNSNVESEGTSDVSSETENTDGGNTTNADINSGTSTETDNGNVEFTESLAGQNVMNSDIVSEEIKNGFKEEGLNYIPRKEAMVAEEAKGYVDAFADNTDALLGHIYNTTNHIPADTRAMIIAQTFKSLSKKSSEVNTIEERANIDKKSLDLMRFYRDFSTKLGQGTNALKAPKEALLKDSKAKLLSLRLEKQIEVEEALSKAGVDTKLVSKEINTFVKNNIDEIIKHPLLKAKIASATYDVDKKAKIKSFWDSKLLKDDNGAAYDVTYLLPAKLYNGTIRLMKNLHLQGLNAAQIIDRAIKHVRNKYTKDWQENEFRVDFEKLVNEMGSPKGITDAKLKANLPDNIRNIVKQHYTKVADVKQSLAAKIVAETGLSGKDAASIEAEVNSKFDALVDKNKSSLIDKFKSTSVNKKVLLGKVVELSNMGALSDADVQTSLGASLGVKELDPAIEPLVYTLSNKMNALEDNAAKLKKDFTEEGYKEYQKAERETQILQKELNHLVNADIPLSTKLIYNMQGNIMVLESLVRNLTSNYALQPFRFAQFTIAAGLDAAISKVTNTKRSLYWTARQKGYIKGNIEGLKKGAIEVKHGRLSDDIMNEQVKSDYSPFKEWSKIKKKPSSAFFATTGSTAETVFRLLNLGDRPASMGAALARGYEIAARKGLTGVEADSFVAFPDAEATAEMKDAAERATFQDANAVDTHLFQAIPKLIDNLEPEDAGKITRGVFETLRVFTKTQALFTKTPLNLAAYSFDLAIPAIPLVRGLYQIKSGNKVLGTENVAKSVMGMAVVGLAYSLFKEGLITHTPEDDEFKERSVMYETTPPNSINISGVMRMLAGGSPNDVKANWVNLNYFGPVGLAMAVTANKMEQKRKEGNVGQLEDYLLSSVTAKTLPTAAKLSLDMSSFKSTQTLLNAIQGEGTDKWQIATLTALSSAVIPNQIATMSRASNEELPDLKGKDFSESLKKTVMNRWFKGGDLTSKINMWGDPIQQTPDGSNKFIYNFLFRVKEDNMTETDKKLFKLYKAIGEEAVYPSPPKRDKIMSDTEWEVYQKAVGKNRRQMMEVYVNSDIWSTLPDDEKLKVLKSAYSGGTELGKEEMGLE